MKSEHQDEYGQKLDQIARQIDHHQADLQQISDGLAETSVAAVDDIIAQIEQAYTDARKQKALEERDHALQQLNKVRDQVYDEINTLQAHVASQLRLNQAPKKAEQSYYEALTSYWSGSEQEQLRQDGKLQRINAFKKSVGISEYSDFQMLVDFLEQESKQADIAGTEFDALYAIRRDELLAKKAMWDAAHKMHDTAKAHCDDPSGLKITEYEALLSLAKEKKALLEDVAKKNNAQVAKIKQQLSKPDFAQAKEQVEQLRSEARHNEWTTQVDQQAEAILRDDDYIEREMAFCETYHEDLSVLLDKLNQVDVTDVDALVAAIQEVEDYLDVEGEELNGFFMAERLSDTTILQEEARRLTNELEHEGVMQTLEKSRIERLQYERVRREINQDNSQKMYEQACRIQHEIDMPLYGGIVEHERKKITEIDASLRSLRRVVAERQKKIAQLKESIANVKQAINAPAHLSPDLRQLAEQAVQQAIHSVAHSDAWQARQDKVDSVKGELETAMQSMSVKPLKFKRGTRAKLQENLASTEINVSLIGRGLDQKKDNKKKKSKRSRVVEIHDYAYLRNETLRSLHEHLKSEVDSAVVNMDRTQMAETQMALTRALYVSLSAEPMLFGSEIEQFALVSDLVGRVNQQVITEQVKVGKQLKAVQGALTEVRQRLKSQMSRELEGFVIGSMDVNGMNFAQYYLSESGEVQESPIRLIEYRLGQLMDAHHKKIWTLLNDKMTVSPIVQIADVEQSYEQVIGATALPSQQIKDIEQNYQHVMSVLQTVKHLHDVVEAEIVHADNRIAITFNQYLEGLLPELFDDIEHGNMSRRDVIQHIEQVKEKANTISAVYAHLNDTKMTLPLYIQAQIRPFCDGLADSFDCPDVTLAQEYIDAHYPDIEEAIQQFSDIETMLIEPPEGSEDALIDKLNDYNAEVFRFMNELMRSQEKPHELEEDLNGLARYRKAIEEELLPENRIIAHCLEDQPFDAEKVKALSAGNLQACLTRLQVEVRQSGLDTPDVAAKKLSALSVLQRENQNVEEADLSMRKRDVIELVQREADRVGKQGGAKKQQMINKDLAETWLPKLLSVTNREQLDKLAKSITTSEAITFHRNVGKSSSHFFKPRSQKNLDRSFRQLARRRSPEGPKTRG